MNSQWRRLLWLALFAWTGLVDAAPSALADLSLIEVPAGKSGTSEPKPLAILITGDGGWARIDRSLSADLAANGIPVVGFDSLHYFWKLRTPEETARDVARTMKHYREAWSRERVMLIGYSLGADVMPFIVNRLPAELREHVCSVVLIGLSDTVAFEVHMKQWLPGTKPEGKPVAPELAKLTPSRLLCLYGSDEQDSLCPSLSRTDARVEQIGSGHHLGGQYGEIAQRIIAASRC
ncbi:virulence factor family protein [Peristeroidobacter soli]|jgi:type IV secretory pathway VirJ component|uniref:virulence factor family protein n=1 Tax=Peristeroidobacter soli TaxID=2497877 RepID=UPI00101D5F14|nr:AcvB/VirJ family lysyl-phosphatidylglycerol hydrolase [Peristeroidobacter soli]